MGGCTLAEGWENVEAAAPYIWPTGIAPEQADAHLAELLGKQLVGKPAEFAGDEAMHDTERVFGWVQAETETGEYAARNDAFDARFEEEYGGEIAVRSTYLFDPGAAQETATTVIARMRDAGVTTVIMSVDPIVPKNITEEATKQGYFPEWVVGPSCSPTRRSSGGRSTSSSGPTPSASHSAPLRGRHADRLLLHLRVVLR
jgi:hypothetical protein